MNEMQDSDSEFSDSSGSVSSSSSSSSESSKNDNSLELAKICGQTLHLPRGLCENTDIFQDFFSLETWNQVPSNFQAYLKNKFLPHFPEGTNNEVEQTKTIKMLFNNDICSFGKSPLNQLQKNLGEGNYRPDLIKLKESIEKSKRIESKFEECERVSKLSKSLMMSRERLLRAAYNAPPGEQIKIDKKLNNSNNVLDCNIAGLRAKKRFYDEITSLAKLIGLSDCSDDEMKEGEELLEADNLNKKPLGGLPIHPANELKIIGTMTKKGRFNGSSMTDFNLRPASLMEDKHLKQMLFTHKRRKIEEPDRPEFEISDVRLIDVNNRVEMTGSNYRKEILAPPKIKKVITKPVPLTNSTNTGTSKNHHSLLKKSQLVNNTTGNNQQSNKQQSLLKTVNTPSDQIKNITVRSQKEQIISNTPASSENEDEINVDSVNSTPIARSIIVSNQKQKNNTLRLMDATEESNKKIKNTGKKQNIPVEHYNQRIGNIENKDNENSRKNIDNGFAKMNPISMDDLDGIDMINLPVSLGDSMLNEETVVADSSSYSLDVKNIQNVSIIKKPRQEECNNEVPQQTSNVGISPELMQETHACYLSLIRDIFCSTPDHRMKLDELKSKIYQWLSNPITALNDWYSQADNWLNLLPSAIHFLSGEFGDQPEEFVPYIEFKTQLSIYQWIGAGRDSDSHLLQLCHYWLSRKHEMGIKPVKSKVEKNRSVESKTFEFEDNLINEKPASPPPPRCPTNWTVQPASTDEIEEFRAQERQRFENPHKAFTYRMYGYESVVGPVKGVYTQILALTKARGHNMLTADRPNFVTILTLVRDATARLPNGEGTRADICELLKCSQYINPQAADNILQTIVSGALDRMHVEIDPCVRYDAKRKIWIYLHRNRTEEEFEKVHQQYQGVTKNQKKSSTRKLKHKQAKSENSLLIQNQNNNKPQVILPPLSVCGQFQVSQNQHNITQQVNAISTSISGSIQTMTPLVVKNQTISQNSPQVAVVAPLKVSPQKNAGNMTKPELIPLKAIQPQLLLNTENELEDNVVDLNEPQTFLVQKQFPQKLLNTNNKTINITNISPHVTNSNQTPIKQIQLQQNQKLGSSNQTGTNIISTVINQQHSNSPDMKPQIISPISASLPQQILASPTQPQQQQTLSAPSNTQFIVTNKTNKTGKPILIQSTNNAGQQVITQIRQNNGQTQQQGFIIPLNSDQFQAISSQLPQVSSGNSHNLISTSGNSPKFIKSTTISSNQISPPALTAVSRPTTIIQQTNPITGKQQFIRIATTSTAGKSLLNQNQISVHQQPKMINNMQLDVDTGETSSNFGQENASLSNSQQKIPTGTVMIRPQIAKSGLTTGLSLINNQNVRVTQPRQILQVQQKQQLQKSNVLQQNTLVISGGQQNQQIQTKNVIIQQQTSSQQNQQQSQVQKIINVSAANLQNLITATTQGGGQTNIISPQIIQLHSSPTNNAGGSGTGKIQTFNANILPTFKTQNIRLQTPISTQGNQQQPIIIKQQMLQHVPQKQTVGTKNSGTVSIGPNSNKISAKNVSSLTSANIITANSSSLAPGTIIQTSPQTLVKHSNIIHQQNKQFTIVSSPQQLQQQQSQTVARVVKSLSSGVGGTTILQPNQIVQTSVGNVVRTQNAGGNPVMAKVITNNTGQIISLESLLQKQGIAPGTTLRVAGTKAGQTNIIQLTNQQQPNNNNNNSSNITDGINQSVPQYAVVSQGRNIISMAGTHQRFMTTQASNAGVTNLVSSTASNVRTISSVTNPNATTSGNQIHNVSKIINANQLTSQQIVNAKVLGKNNTSNIRMNLTNIRGKPVILTNKQGNQQSNTAQNVQLIQNNQIVGGSNTGNTGNIVIGGQTLKVQGNMMSAGNIQVINQSSSQPQAVMLGNQILKVAQASNVRQTIGTNIIASSLNNRTNTVNSGNTLTSIASTNSGTMVVNSNNTAGLNQSGGPVQTKTVVLGSTGQPIRVQSTGQIQTVAIGNNNNSGGMQQTNQQIILGHSIKGTPLKTTGQQRVVLAVQGGGQILLPSGFQGGSLNLKSLQGLKVVQVGQANQQSTIQQSQQNKGKN